MSDSAGTAVRPPDPEADAVRASGAGPPPAAHEAPPGPTLGGRIGPVRFAVIAIAFVVGAVSSVAWALSLDQGGHQGHHAIAAHTAHAGHGAAPASASAAEPRGGAPGVERYHRPDPTLPAVAPGRVKRFRVDVLMHRMKWPSTPKDHTRRAGWSSATFVRCIRTSTRKRFTRPGATAGRVGSGRW